jgi:hypothetical protein
MLIYSHPDGHRANAGGPSSRARSERIRSTLLGLTKGPIRCPLNLNLALDFARRDPVATAYRLLAQAGFHNPDDLRTPFGETLWPMVCRPNPELQPLEVATADPLAVLRLAFMLGLCTSVRFDPERPVLWTRASLTRRLELYEMKEFYA